MRVFRTLSMDERPESSIDLLTRARAGDSDALDRLCHRYRYVLRRWARGRLPAWARDLIDTEDLVQETLLNTVRKIGAFEPRNDGALQAYLRQALQNRLRDEIRRQRRVPDRGALDSETPDPAPSALENAVGLQNIERYEVGLARLKEEERELIVLRLEMGLSYEDLAAAVGKPSANAARVAVLRALLRLGEEIEREG